tara:strand:- start:310 stop:519 length:210 start_codon:yes stop_codon:yes gene_type:complete
MNTAFKNLGDFIKGLTTLVMSLIGLGILLQVAGVGGFIDVIGAIGDAVGRIGNDFTGLVTLLVVLAFLK